MHIDCTTKGARALASVAIGGLAVCGIVMNATFGWQQGSNNFERGVFVAMSILVDTAKVLGIGFIVAAASKRAWGKAATASVIWALCVLYGMNSAAVFASGTHAQVVAERAATIAAAKAVDDNIADMKAKVDIARTKKLWESTGGCTTATKKDSKDFCYNYLVALGEYNAAVEKAPVKKILAEADPTVAFWQKITPASADQIGLAIAIGMAGLLELVTSFGGFAFSRTIAAPVRRSREEIQAERRNARRREQRRAGKPNLKLVA